MAQVNDQLRQYLENPRLQESLVNAFVTVIDSPGKLSEADLSVQLRSSRRKSFKQLLESIFQTFVVDHLPRPLPVTAEDLRSISIQQLAGLPLAELSASDQISPAYKRFIAFVLQEVERERPSQRAIDLGYYSIRDEELDSYYAPNFQLWTSPAGFTLYGESQGGPSNTNVDGFLKGYSSNRAMKQLEAEIRGVIDSIVMTVRSCVTKADYKDGDSDESFNPPIRFLVEDGRLVMSTCLSAFCEGPGSGRVELLDRLRNAIVLLSHADQIESDPLGLSLSFAAIEALVCEKDELAVTKQIKRHVATLLVKDPARRKSKEKVIDRLYAIRSTVLHGSKVEASTEASESARRIAAGVIRAVACWCENLRRTGFESTWKELMDELNAASRKPGEVVGVSDLSELIPDKVPS